MEEMRRMKEDAPVFPFGRSKNNDSREVRMVCFQFSCLFRKLKKQFKRYCEEAHCTQLKHFRMKHCFASEKNPDWLYFTHCGA